MLFSLDAEPARFTRRAVVVFPASVLSNTTMKNYPKQKFYEAVSALIGNSSIEMRLTYAAEPLLMLQPNELPEKMRHEFELLLNDLRQKSLSRETQIMPRPVTKEEARKLAERILGMYTELMGGL